jgi:hypothetical protein
MRKDDQMLNEMYAKVHQPTIEEAGLVSRVGASIGGAKDFVTQGAKNIGAAFQGKTGEVQQNTLAGQKQKRIIDTLVNDVINDVTKLGLVPKGQQLDKAELTGMLNTYLDKINVGTQNQTAASSVAGNQPQSGQSQAQPSGGVGKIGTIPGNAPANAPKEGAPAASAPQQKPPVSQTNVSQSTAKPEPVSTEEPAAPASTEEPAAPASTEEPAAPASTEEPESEAGEAQTDEEKYKSENVRNSAKETMTNKPQPNYSKVTNDKGVEYTYQGQDDKGNEIWKDAQGNVNTAGGMLTTRWAKQKQEPVKESFKSFFKLS